jgi:hypothetical protein
VSRLCPVRCLTFLAASQPKGETLKIVGRGARQWVRKIAVVIAVGATLFAVAPMGAAYAATCSGNGCNGQDPAASGCSASVSVLNSMPMRLPSGTQVGTIEMRYSKICKTQWIRVYSYYTNCSGEPCRNSTYIYRPAGPDGGGVEYYDTGRGGAGQPYQWSSMVYTPNTRSCGRGEIDADGQLGYANGSSQVLVCG